MMKIPVVFVFDDEWAIPSSVSIISLLENAQTDTCYEVFIISRNLGAKKQDALKKQFARYHNHTLRIIIISSEILDKISHFPVTAFFTIDIYIRLFLHHILKNHEKVIYCDCDTLILEDLTQIFNQDISSVYLSAVLDIPSNRLIHRGEMTGFGAKYLGKYINSGFLIMNLGGIRKNGIFNSLEAITIHKYPDQEILNITCFNSINYLSQKYNFQLSQLELFDNNEPILDIVDIRDDYYQAVKNPAVIHYTGAIKPWQAITENKFNKMWWEYSTKSAFSEELYALKEPIESTTCDPYNFESFLEKNSNSRIALWGAGVGFKKCFAPLINKKKLDILVVDQDNFNQNIGEISVKPLIALNDFKPNFIIIGCGAPKSIIETEIQKKFSHLPPITIITADELLESN